jgi:threonine dehydrogenase-like Zn-dependent dehydrogenase
MDKGTIMGHEFVGIIHEVGDAVTTFSIGERVFSPFTTSCDTVRKILYKNLLFNFFSNFYSLIFFSVFSVSVE